MLLYLVRHAHAGQRRHDGRDIYRPLSPGGQERAAELVEVFADHPVDRLLSSPATRCAQTLAPLGFQRGLEVEECQELWEGSSVEDTLRALETALETALDTPPILKTSQAIETSRALKIEGDQSIVACSHGDVIPALIDALGARGVPISGRGCELGSIWVLSFDGGRWRSARYVNSRARALA